MLEWARVRSGFTVEKLAARMKMDAREVGGWEDGTVLPSYTVLEVLADRYLKIPVALFFFPAPPRLDDPKGRLRRLPDYELARLSPDSLYKINMAQAYQESLIELLGSRPRPDAVFALFDPRRLSVRRLAAEVRNRLGVTLEQQLAYRSTETAFKGWRHAVEAAGVFAFKDTFKDDFVSGFCLLHNVYPVIFVNNSTAHARQTFTLMHELGHILYGVDGVTDIDESYIRFMREADVLVEKNCNQFAAELLVPHESFDVDINHFRLVGIEGVAAIAQKYRVSREVILRRLLERGEVSSAVYARWASQWRGEYRRREGTKGGNYYLTKLAYLGEGFTHVAMDSQRRGRITYSELASHLNMNARHVPRLAKYLRQ